MNGDIAILVPGQLLVFEAPDDTVVSAAGQRDYVDISGRRHFSSAFYADLLADLGATLVVSFNCNETDGKPAAAAATSYAAAGLAYYPLHAVCGGACASLQSLDRFVALAAGASGPIAVEWHRGSAAGGGADVYLTALLLRRRSFATAEQALAWIRMARPAGPVRPPGQAVLQLLHSQSPGAVTGDTHRLGGCRSLSASSCMRSLPSPPPAAGVSGAQTDSDSCGGGPGCALLAAGRLGAQSLVGRAYSSPGELSESLEDPADGAGPDRAA